MAKVMERKEVIATVTSKGQMTVPVAIRERLGVRDGGRVLLEVAPDGTVTVRALKYPTVASLVGAGNPLGRKFSDMELKRIAREARAEDIAKRKL
jgi:AbrB family looped-hinge helix DNA binding protein